MMISHRAWPKKHTGRTCLTCNQPFYFILFSFPRIVCCIIEHLKLERNHKDHCIYLSPPFFFFFPSVLPFPIHSCGFTELCIFLYPPRLGPLGSHLVGYGLHLDLPASGTTCSLMTPQSAWLSCSSILFIVLLSFIIIIPRSSLGKPAWINTPRCNFFPDQLVQMNKWPFFFFFFFSSPPPHSLSFNLKVLNQITLLE